MQPSPNFRSMIPASQAATKSGGGGVLRGLLPDSPQAWGAAPPVPGIMPALPSAGRRPFDDEEPSAGGPQSWGAAPPMGPQAPPQQMSQASMPSAVTSPSRGSFLYRPASQQYARTPAPATSPGNVWQSPSARPITDSLLDSPGDTAGEENSQPPPEPEMPAGDLAADLDELEVEPADQGEPLQLTSDQLMQLQIPDYFAPLMYQPLQPSRRYEVV